MRGHRFYTEDFRGVMSAEQKIHAEFFSDNSGPVRSFAGDKRVDVFVCHPVNFRASAASHNANRASLFGTKIENLYRAVQRFPQFANEFAPRHRRARFQADRLTFFFQKRLRRSKSKRGDELCVVANFWMDIQREMRAVKRDIILKRDLQLPAKRASHRL